MSFHIPGITHDRVSIEAIKFAATQVASSGANDLDDYEEGSWTPVIGGSGGTSGQTYATQAGNYIKIGRLVLVSFFVQFSAKGTITGNVQIQGLPFAIDNGTGSYGMFGGLRFSSMATNWTWIGGQFTPNTTTADAVGMTAAGTGYTNLVTADLNNASAFIGSAVYVAGS